MYIKLSEFKEKKDFDNIFFRYEDANNIILIFENAIKEEKNNLIIEDFIKYLDQYLDFIDDKYSSIYSKIPNLDEFNEYYKKNTAIVKKADIIWINVVLKYDKFYKTFD